MTEEEPPRCGAFMMGGGGYTTCARPAGHEGHHLEQVGTWRSVNRQEE